MNRWLWLDHQNQCENAAFLCRLKSDNFRVHEIKMAMQKTM
jgi:hypothetical protein